VFESVLCVNGFLCICILKQLIYVSSFFSSICKYGTLSLCFFYTVCIVFWVVMCRLCVVIKLFHKILVCWFLFSYTICCMMIYSLFLFILDSGCVVNLMKRMLYAAILYSVGWC
jgi:hypothetical protein